MVGLPALVVSHGPFDYHSFIPRAIFTGTGSDPRPRLRVDQAQTSFFENREFRVYHEFTGLASGASIWFKYVFPVDVIIHSRMLTVVAGQMRYAQSTVGTESGVWIAKTVYPANTLSTRPSYTGQSTIFTGGTVSGAVERDIMLVNAGTGGNSATASTDLAETGLGASTVYVELKNSGSGVSSGVYRVEFEEYASTAPVILLP